jgi:hypothetical protein
MQTKQMQAAEQFLRLAFQPGNVIEIRALSDEGSISFLFDDMHEAARTAITLNTKYMLNVYFTLNSLNRDTDTVRNHVLNFPKLHGYRSAADRDIERRNLYLIDIDPVRPSRMASSPIELSNAKAVALDVRAFLKAKGWPEPVELCSGNGIHLLYRGEGPAADYLDWKNALKYLAYRFGTADAKIDTSVYNPGRISRLPGCFNRKGEDTPQRPHRMARVISYPPQFEVVPITKVRELTFEDQRFYPTNTTHADRELVIDEEGLRDLIESYPEVLSISKERTSGTQTMFGLAECPFVERAHRDQRVGVSKTVILIDPTKNKIGFKCLSDELPEHTFGDLRKLLEERTGRPTPQVFLDEEFDFFDLLANWGCGEFDEEDYGEDFSEEEEDEGGDTPSPAPAAPRPAPAPVTGRPLTVEELTLRLGLRDPDDPPSVKPRILTVDELTVRLGLKDGGLARV